MKTYDEILQGIITNMRNTPLARPTGGYEEPTVSKGSILYLVAVALAGCVWGLYKLADWILRQMFVTTANDDNVIRHAANIGLTRLPDETIDELKERYFLKRRAVVIVGNTDQYRLWALSVEGVKAAYVIPQGRGMGTILVYILARTPDEMATPELLAAVYAALTDPAKVNAWQGRIIVEPLTFFRPDIAINAITETPEAAAIAIRSYLAGLEAAESLTRDNLLIVLNAIAINNPSITIVLGGQSIEAILPAAGEIIRAGEIRINGDLYV